MKPRVMYLATILAAVLLLGGCSGAAKEQAQAPRPTNAPGSTADHSHGPKVSKLGLAPAVVDGVQEVLDVALIADGKLVEVDLLNTVGMLVGIFAIPKEDTVLITIHGKAVAWSDTKTDYPVVATIPGPIKRVDNRVRMSAAQLEQLVKIYWPAGKVEVKGNKLHITTGR